MSSARPKAWWSGRRASLGTVAVVAALVVYFELIHGTPTAILFAGLVAGMLNALIAAGLILVYRSSRTINFAQTAIGAAGAELTFQLVTLTKTPYWFALLAGLLLAAGVGAIFELALVRRFFHAPRLVLTVATIAAAGFLGTSAARFVNYLPFFPRNRSFLADLGALPIRDRVPFAGFHFQVGSFPLRFGVPELLALEVSVVALLVVAGFFRYTRAGIAVRAMAENSDRAALLGVSVGGMSLIVWTLAGLLSGAGVIMTGTVTLPGAAAGIAPTVLFPALAAAVLARMRSLPVAVAASVGIAVFTSAWDYDFPKDQALVSFGLLLIISVALLVQRKTLQRGEERATGSWAATEEQRPVPRELRGLGPIRFGRWGIAVFLIGGLVLFPFVVSTGLTNLGGVIALDAIAALSLVVLTGWAGQVSLGQYGLIGIGSVVGGSLIARAGVPFWLAIPLTAALTSVFAVVVGIPALRIKGLFLAVTTFGFAVAVHDVLFSSRYFGWLLPGDISRPSLLFLNFQDERSTYFLCVAGLLVSIVVVLNLRRSRFARVLIAARENEADLQAFGVSVVRAKLMAFALSGALCGFAGALLAIQARGVAPSSFIAQRSIDVFLLAVLGGITSAAGALIGVAYFDLTQYFLGNNIVIQSLGFSGAVVVLLYIEPAGLIALVNRMRDGVLRIVAQRRQIVVPSLFADFDPAALEHRLIPLSEPGSGGLAALGGAKRWRMPSQVHGIHRLAGSNGHRDEVVARAASGILSDAADDASPADGEA